MAPKGDSLLILLMAAGSAQRFGANKLMAPFRGQTIIRRSVDIAVATGFRVAVVIGAYEAELRGAVDGADVIVDFNSSWYRGLGCSIAHGVRTVTSNANPPAAVIVAMADQVALQSTSYIGLATRYVESGREDIIVSRSKGSDCPPCLFPAFAFPALMALDGDRGARRVLEQWSSHVVRHSLPEAAYDVDTVDDLAVLTRSATGGRI
ncbi:MAG: nucleotidyltransferase family protein [Lysobacteraceae bacterium]